MYPRLDRRELARYFDGEMRERGPDFSILHAGTGNTSALEYYAPLFSASNFARNAVQGTAPLAAPDPRIPLGERLVYDMFWFGVPVGTGEVWVKEKTALNGREAFHGVGKATGSPFLAGLYPVMSEAHGWIDAETLESLAFSKKVHEGHVHLDEKITYDSAAGRRGYESFKTGERSGAQDVSGRQARQTGPRMDLFEERLAPDACFREVRDLLRSRLRDPPEPEGRARRLKSSNTSPTPS